MSNPLVPIGQWPNCLRAALTYSAPSARAAMKDNLQIAADRIAELEAVMEKLPLTEDGVRVVPNVDPIWINPEEPGGWPHNEWWGGSETREVVFWMYHSDHLFVRLDADEFGDYWFGKFYSTREAAEQAKEASDGQ